MKEILLREWTYFWYYFTLQIRLIAPYWVLGMALGSAVSVFLKDTIHALFLKVETKRSGLAGLIPASLIGIASPLCMYGTIPLAASFSESGMEDDVLAAFMMASVLLNPQLIVYSAALGTAAVIIRFVSCFLCGVVAGFLVHIFYTSKKNADGTCKKFFDFTGFKESESHDTDPNIFLRYLKNLWRNLKATGLWFLIGIVITSLYQRYIPADMIGKLFGSHKGFGLLTAAALGVPLYVCGGGTIPLIAEWLDNGMSLGAASAFMITGPATKITNLGAMKIVLGIKRFLIYIAFSITFAMITGIIVDVVV